MVVRQEPSKTQSCREVEEDETYLPRGQLAVEHAANRASARVCFCVLIAVLAVIMAISHVWRIC